MGLRPILCLVSEATLLGLCLERVNISFLSYDHSDSTTHCQLELITILIFTR